MKSVTYALSIRMTRRPARNPVIADEIPSWRI
jgi:hypothetical protein